MHHLRSAFALAGLLLALSLTASPPVAAEAGAGIPEAVAARLGVPAGMAPAWVSVATSKDEKFPEADAGRNAPDIVSFDACHVGGQRLLFRVGFARRPDFAGATFIVYADLDCDRQTGRRDETHAGVDVMVVITGNNISLSFHDNKLSQGNTAAGGAVDGSTLYLVLDAPLPAEGDKVPIDLQLLSQRPDGRGDSTARAVAQFPRSAQAVAKLNRAELADLRGLSDYRYHDDLVKLERLSDKGLRAEQVMPANPAPFGRPRPAVPFTAAARKPGQAGSAARQQVRVRLLEEAGVARAATPVTFGFPFPKGALFDPARARVLSVKGAELPAQVTATAFWPDDSLKWALIDLDMPLQPREETEVAVEFGSQVERAVAPSPLKVAETPATLTVTTGPLQVVLDKQRFNLFREVRRNANGRFEAAAMSGEEGIRLVDEAGKVFTAAGRPPESFRVEEKGPRKVVVRVEGAYAAADGAAYMRYVARLTFRAGSARVGVALTHIDDYLRTEFTDITSLSMPMAAAGGTKQAALFLRGDDGKLQAVEGQPASLFQVDEAKCVLQAGREGREAGKAPGIARVAGARGVVTVAVRDFWQRWPKGLSADGRGLSVDILPPQPGPDYGKGLPHYLLYPFVAGRYRFKWGMSFTERMLFDFGGPADPAELDADMNAPVVATVPGAWHARTGALGRVAAPLEKQFAAWDAYAAAAYAAHEKSRIQAREYGYFNYGDWYGERGRNWGNNEYDFAHGYFMQFARTGNRDYFRSALLAARHQADVDCVHAYPDPFYVGANHLHSIGHTGMWSQDPPLVTWTWPYDYHTGAANGHSWADGMMDAWYLTGDPVVMDAALGFGEHVAWGMSRAFNALGTHERSAGWSLKAVMAVYRGTYDPEYLEAAKRIAAVALREQKLDQGGSWPHLLPRDHAGGHAGATGNNLFLIGILLGGLQALHEETGDPAVQKALVAGAEWVMKSWDENAEGWPYSASPSGEPWYTATTGLNMLIIQPLAYVGKLTGDERFLRAAETALRATVRGGADAFGKSVAQKMNFTSGTLALLQEWYSGRPDKGASMLAGGTEGLDRWAARAAVAERHRVRAPNEKLFCVRLKGAGAELVAARSPHGAMTKTAATGTIRVLDAAGAVVKAGEFSTDDAYELRCPLQGAAGAVFRVAISDDQRGVWHVGGDGLGIVAKTVSGFRIGGVGRARYHLFVPEGTKEFRIRLLGVHSGTYGGAILAPGGKVAALHQAANPGQALIPGAPQGAVDNTHPEQGTLVVRPAPGDTGKVWGLALWAATDLGCELEGVPPYLSRTAEEWFLPE